MKKLRSARDFLIFKSHNSHRRWWWWWAIENLISLTKRAVAAVWEELSHSLHNVLHMKIIFSSFNSVTCKWKIRWKENLKFEIHHQKIFWVRHSVMRQQLLAVSTFPYLFSRTFSFKKASFKLLIKKSLAGNSNYST